MSLIWTRTNHPLQVDSKNASHFPFTFDTHTPQIMWGRNLHLSVAQLDSIVHFYSSKSSKFYSNQQDLPNVSSYVQVSLQVQPVQWLACNDSRKTGLQNCIDHWNCLCNYLNGHFNAEELFPGTEIWNRTSLETDWLAKSRRQRGCVREAGQADSPMQCGGGDVKMPRGPRIRNLLLGEFRAVTYFFLCCRVSHKKTCGFIFSYGFYCNSCTTHTGFSIEVDSSMPSNIRKWQKKV